MNFELVFEMNTAEMVSSLFVFLLMVKLYDYTDEKFDESDVEGVEENKE